MITASSLLQGVAPNENFTSLPLFDRTGWKRMAFGAFAESIGERAEPKDAQEEIYVGLEHLDPQCLHIRRWGKGSDVTGTKLRFRKGDIIFGRRRAYQRKLAVAEFDGICSAHAMVVRAKPDKVLPEFLPFLMMSDRFMNRAVEISVGSLSPTINWTTLKLEEFDLPPLDQQRRIAEILWAVDGAAQTERRALTHAEDCRSSILAEYFPNDLTFADMRRLGRSGEKNFSTLKDVTRRITDGVHLTPDFSSEGVPFLLVSNLASGTMDWNIERWVTHETYLELTKTKKAEVGDVLYTVVASFGIPVYMDWERPFCFQRHIALIKPNPERLLGRYLVLFLQSQLGKRQAEIYAEGNAQR